jgi:hypothetical protein
MDRAPTIVLTLPSGWRQPMPELFQTTDKGRPIEPGPAHPDRIHPPDFVSVKKLTYKMLTTGRVAPPVIREDQERRLVFHRHIYAYIADSDEKKLPEMPQFDYFVLRRMLSLVPTHSDQRETKGES